MSQIFHPAANTIAKFTIFGGVFFVIAAFWAIMEINRSSYVTSQWVQREQPVQFSHRHHAGDDGIDCRYCHTTVEISNTAGMPPTKTCMNCHSQIWSDSPYLEPVRASYRTGEPIVWQRVHNLPDFVYFNHSIHVNKGVGCSSCHGNVADMPVVYQFASLQMEWCLACHRNPEAYLRPKDQITKTDWVAPPDQLARGRALNQQQYHLRDTHTLTSCSTCHR